MRFRTFVPQQGRQQTQPARAQRLEQAQALIRRRRRQAQVGVAELQMGSRRRRIAAVRSELAVHRVTRLGLSLAEAARQLGISTSGVAKAVA
jgi:putative transposase